MHAERRVTGIRCDPTEALSGHVLQRWRGISSRARRGQVPATRTHTRPCSLVMSWKLETTQRHRQVSDWADAHTAPHDRETSGPVNESLCRVNAARPRHKAESLCWASPMASLSELWRPRLEVRAGTPREGAGAWEAFLSLTRTKHVFIDFREGERKTEK